MKFKSSTLLLLLLPLSVYCQNSNTIKVYGNGNTSLKIRDTKDTLSNTEKLTWLQNSALAFSNNEQELYFRHPTDNYYQVWNIASKQKTAEVPFSEAGNTAAGRRIMASFHNVAYSKDSYLNSKIWISEDLNISFNKNDGFDISSPQNIFLYHFSIYPRSYAFESNFIDYERFIKKVPLTNINYYFNFHKKSNQLYVIITGDQITKDKNIYPYCGVYRFNLTTDTKEELLENLDAQYIYDKRLKFSWHFSDNTISNFFVTHPDMKFKEFDLGELSKKDVRYGSWGHPDVYGDLPNNSWCLQYVGTDSSGNPYLCTPLNNSVSIQKLDRKGKGSWEQFVNILHDNGRDNKVQREQNQPETMLNVMAVSPSGKLIAYLNLYNHNDAGKTASIMLYNDAEKDRVYTLNDQTKFQPYIAKSYITNKESEALALSWSNQKNEAKEKRRALYKGQVDSLKTKIAEADSMLAATYQRDIDLSKQHKYGEILAGKQWHGYFTETQEITYRKGKPWSFVVIADFSVYETLSFIDQGNTVLAVYRELLSMPGGSTNNDGEYIIKEHGVGAPSVVVSTECKSLLADLDGNRILTKPEFRLNNAFGDCTDPSGKKQLELSSAYQEFTNEFLGFLMGSKFGIGKTGASSKIRLVATGKNGKQITFDYDRTTLQEQIINKKEALESEIKTLEKLIENGN